MTSAHGNNFGNNFGNKTIAATAGVCLTTAALVLGGLASEKRSKIRLYEKKYSKALSALEMNNQKAQSGEQSFSEVFDK